MASPAASTNGRSDQTAIRKSVGAEDTFVEDIDDLDLATAWN
jgi:hypothetical protein